MPCYKPLQAIQTGFTKSGKASFTFVGSVTSKVPLLKRIFSKFGYFVNPSKVIQLPCGQCVGCRLKRSAHWAMRCVHECQSFEKSCFITLTFSPEHLPNPPNLNVRTFQLFMKRLRKHFTGISLRFFHCGEYGDRYGRPHYHAIIFGIDFPDKQFLKMNNGFPLFTSSILSKLWGFGHASIGAVTFESAAYVARYCMKKINGSAAEKHYSFCSKTGEVFTRTPEYTTMSRRPGIGSDWFKKYRADVFPGDFAVINGRKMSPPRFYDIMFETEFPSDFEDIKAKRKALALKFSSDNTPVRLATRLECTLAKIANLIRPVDRS